MPPIPPNCPHFVGTFFWCAEPCGEPWRMDEYLSPWQRATISAVAESYWRKAIRKAYEDFRAGGYEGEHPDLFAGECREAIEKWRGWEARTN